MKLIFSILSFLLFTSCASSKDVSFAASTPATSQDVRTFLGILLSDSVDFIRWNLTINDKHYSLECNYGISKPNTNGFMNGGGKVIITGTVIRENNIYKLINKRQLLKLVELNTNLLHIADMNNNLLIGNGGWSYALNIKTPVASDQLRTKTKPFDIKDSLHLVGRTPCDIPNVNEPGQECYKLKWSLKLYKGTNNESGNYYLRGSRWYEQGGLRSTWKMITGKDGRIIYQLNDIKGNPFLNLLKLDDGVLIFIDTKGNLLVGDHDFSYILNRE